MLTKCLSFGATRREALLECTVFSLLFASPLGNKARGSPRPAYAARE